MTGFLCTAVLAIGISPESGAGNSASSLAEGRAPAFLSACEVGGEDPHFAPGTILVIVHTLGQRATVPGDVQTNLFAISDLDSDPSFWGIGWMHWGGDRFFEAEGGMLSAAIAEDVFNFLVKRKFDLVEDWMEALRHGTSLEPCKIVYAETD